MANLELRIQSGKQPLEPIGAKKLAMMKSFFTKRLTNKEVFQITTKTPNHGHTLTVRSKLSDIVYPIFFFDQSAIEDLDLFHKAWNKYTQEHLIQPLCIFSNLKKNLPSDGLIRNPRGKSVSFLFEYIKRSRTRDYIVIDKENGLFSNYRISREGGDKKRASTRVWQSDGIKLEEITLVNNCRTLRVHPSVWINYKKFGTDAYQGELEL